MEAKLKTWAVKYGKEQEVQQILTEYRSFVGTRNIFQEFDRAFHEMQQVSEVYKKDSELSKYLFMYIHLWTYEWIEVWVCSYAGNTELFYNVLSSLLLCFLQMQVKLRVMELLSS